MPSSLSVVVESTLRRVGFGTLWTGKGNLLAGIYIFHQDYIFPSPIIIFFSRRTIKTHDGCLYFAIYEVQLLNMSITIFVRSLLITSMSMAWCPFSLCHIFPLCKVEKSSLPSGERCVGGSSDLSPQTRADNCNIGDYIPCASHRFPIFNILID